MSSRHRNEEKRQQASTLAELREIENARLAARTMFEKIEDCGTVHDFKEVLHEIAQKVGLE